MMMSCDDYYEYRLKPKSVEQLQTEIRSLKRSINKLKHSLENPYYVSKVVPYDSARLAYHFGYLRVAKVALAEAGGEYKLTKAEQKAEDFQNNIPYISLISFFSDDYIEEYEMQYIKIADGRILSFTGSAQTQKPVYSDITSEKINTEVFFERLSRLYLGEWQRHYDSGSYEKPSPKNTVWKLKICYSNGHRPFVSEGCGVFPYNYREMEDLLECYIP